jgi:hypothetical protein
MRKREIGSSNIIGAVIDYAADIFIRSLLGLSGMIHGTLRAILVCRYGG